MKKLLLWLLTIFSLLSTGFICNTVINNRKIVEKKNEIKNFISIGDKLDNAENILKSKKYKLFYPKAIDPTGNKKYLQQIIIVSEWSPNFIDTINYTASINLPFGTESPYIIIKANNDQVISEIQ